jgi:hypothetical protein
MTPPVAHRVTSAHLQAAYAFVADGGLPCSHVYVGRDLFGSSFVFDPWQRYQPALPYGPIVSVNLRCYCG